MTSSRHTRIKENQLVSQTTKRLILTIAILLCMFFFGPTTVIRLTSLFATTKNDETEKKELALFAPMLDPILGATNSASFKLQGTAASAISVQLKHNGKKAGETKAKDDGSFIFGPLKLIDGENTFTARVVDGERESEDSEMVSIIYKKTDPEVEISSPQAGSTIREEKSQITIEGATDPESILTINERIVAIQGDGSFSYLYRPSKGENKLKIQVTDIAGNKTQEEFSFNYDP